MLYELGLIEMPSQAASVILGIIVGIAFGFLAQRSKFCLRRGLVAGQDRGQALGVWLTALAVAILGVQFSVSMGWISFDAHRFMASDVPVLAILVGGAMFGAGMVLTRGCISRLTVLSATGNMRALIVISAFAIVAHATLKGVLSPIRTSLGSFTVGLGESVSLATLPGGAVLWTVLLAGAALFFGIRSGARVLSLVMAGLIGLLVAVAWVGTGFLLLDEFEPIAMQSLSFTSPWADTLFWTVASTAIPAGFGVGLVGGVLVGSFLAAALFREFSWASFETPTQTLRYLGGAFLMGMGGVLAGGCTVGAGLAGIPTLSVAALLALGAIVVGALVMDRVFLGRMRHSIAVPAE